MAKQAAALLGSPAPSAGSGTPSAAAAGRRAPLLSGPSGPWGGRRARAQPRFGPPTPSDRAPEPPRRPTCPRRAPTRLQTVAALDAACLSLPSWTLSPPCGIVHCRLKPKSDKRPARSVTSQRCEVQPNVDGYTRRRSDSTAGRLSPHSKTAPSSRRRGA